MGLLTGRLAGAICCLALLLGGLSVPSSEGMRPPRRNGLVAFVLHTYSGYAAGIAVIQPNGTGLHQLTADRRDRSPAWSPDGAQLAFERAGHIYVMHADGTNVTRLAPDRSARDYQPTWSPDGRRIAFVSSGALYLMRADGTAIRRVYRQRGAQIEDPAWSPQGRWIAVTLDEGLNPSGDARGSLALINTKGSSIRYLTDSSVGQDSDVPGEWAQDDQPDWSPDGSRLVFTRMVWLCGSCDVLELYTIDANGNNLAPLTRTSGEAWSPSWSRGGQRIAANTGEGMAVLRLDGSVMWLLDAGGSEPAWQPRSLEE
jgi:Tol biopolymer transport system component